VPQGLVRQLLQNIESSQIMNAAARAGFMKLDENGKRIGTGIDGCEGYLLWSP
jgi:hypothetical protein